jgi:hypothetical protein
MEMRNIYQRSQNTLIWLGDTSENSEEALKLVPKLIEAADLDVAEGTERNLWEIEGDRRGLPKAHDQIWYDLFKILERPWFRRAWIVQEVSVSPRPTILCGETTLDWASFVKAITYLVDAGGFGARLGAYATQQFQNLDSQRGKFRGGQEPELFYMLLQNLKAHATDPRDHIFAFHGFFKAPSPEDSASIGYSTTKPDYGKECAKVYKDVAIKLLTHRRDLDIFTLTRVDERSNREGLEDLPTWVPNWSSGDLAESFLWHVCGDFSEDHKSVYRASGESLYDITFDKEEKKLEVDGWVIDEVNMTGPVLESENHLVHNEWTKWAESVIKVQKTLGSWEAIACSSSTYPSGESNFDAYWQTLQGGCVYGNYDAIRASFYIWYRHNIPFRILQIMRLDQVWVLKLGLLLQGLFFWIVCGILKFDGIARLLQVDPVTTGFPQLATHMSYRRMIKTDNGLFGLAGPLTVPGDTIVLCSGGKLPLVLRPNGEDWKLVGECYIHGIMDGSLWDMLEAKTQRCGGIWALYDSKDGIQRTRQKFWLV